MATVSCPSCRARFRLPSDMADGEHLICPDCGQMSAAPRIDPVPVASRMEAWTEPQPGEYRWPEYRTLYRPTDPPPAESAPAPAAVPEASAVGLAFTAILGVLLGFFGYLFATQETTAAAAPSGPPGPVALTRPDEPAARPGVVPAAEATTAWERLVGRWRETPGNPAGYPVGFEFRADRTATVTVRSPVTRQTASYDGRVTAVAEDGDEAAVELEGGGRQDAIRFRHVRGGAVEIVGRSKGAAYARVSR